MEKEARCTGITLDIGRLNWDKGNMKKLMIVPALIIASTIKAFGAEDPAERLVPTCQQVQQIAERVIVDRINGVSFEDVMDRTSALDLRGVRWVIQLLVYDAYFAPEPVYDPAVDVSDRSKRLSVGAFMTLWDMECHGVEAWMEKQEDRDNAVTE